MQQVARPNLFCMDGGWLIHLETRLQLIWKSSYETQVCQRITFLIWMLKFIVSELVSKDIEDNEEKNVGNHFMLGVPNWANQMWS